jgi:hypothetical protein
MGVDLVVFEVCFSESSIHRFAVSSPVGLETILPSFASETSFFGNLTSGKPLHVD